MIDEFKVQKALLTQLDTLAGTIPEVITEGETTNDYTRETLLIAPTTQRDLGGGSTQRGIYQIDVLTNKTKNKFYNLKQAGLIKAGFTIGSSYTHDGQSVQVQGLTVSGARTEGAFFVRSISVNYIVFS